MSLVTVIGYMAALFSMTSFVPQAWKIIRSRQVKGLSAGMYLLTVAAFALWLVYGALQKQWPLVVSNGVCFALSGFILAMTLMPKAVREKVSKASAGK